MTSFNQGLVMSSIEGITGMIGFQYNEDWENLWNLQGVPAGFWNERMLMWININLGSNYTNLPQAMQAYANASGQPNWGSVTSVSGALFPLDLVLYQGASNNSDVILRVAPSI